jgi:haloacetate dehalogenase
MMKSGMDVQCIAAAIRRTTCRANGIRQFYLEAGAGPPVILLHGFPETSFAWRFQSPALAAYYRVIPPGLRGYGETDKPSKGYDKRTMANDVVALAKTLGVDRVAQVGHDRGARVATRLVKDHPELVDRLVVMDNVPTRIVAREMNAMVAREYWFFMFHQIFDSPEALIAGREDIWLRHFFSNWCHDPTTISGEAFETYVKSYSAPGAVRGAMSDYRASGEDIAHDLEDADRKIRCPVLSLWREDFGAVGRLFDMKAIWRAKWRKIFPWPRSKIAAIFRGKNSRKSLTSCFSTSSKVGTVETAKPIGRSDPIARHQRTALFGAGSVRDSLGAIGDVVQDLPPLSSDDDPADLA